MSRYRKIIWNEGMLLTPHHFQQWDNYYEELLASRFQTLASHLWGVLELQIDREAVANGTFRLVSCRGVMRDGLFFNISGGNEPEPEGRDIEPHFSTTDEKLDVYLAIPAKRDGAISYQAGSQTYNQNGAPVGAATQHVRFLEDTVTVVDETTGRNAQPLAVARGNFCLLLGDEVKERGGYTTLKIAELRRTATGQIRVSDRYLPPALNVRVSPWLVDTVRKLVEILINRSSTLSEERRHGAGGRVEFNVANVADFWLLHTVNAALPALAHLSRTPLVHPERLYAELIALAGALMTFVSNRHPKDIVAYDHDNLYLTFNRLSAELMELIEVLIPKNCVLIPLEILGPENRDIYFGQIPEELLSKETTFYLGVRAEIETRDLIDGVPRQLTVGAHEKIHDFVNGLVRGVLLHHTASPPAAISAHERFQYFQLERHNPYWEGVKKTGKIAIYVPDNFTEVKLELYALKS